MSNIKLIGNTWDTSGVYDATHQKTQDQINKDVPYLNEASINIVNGDFHFAQGGYSRNGNKLSSSYASRYLIQGEYASRNTKTIYTTSNDYKITVHAFYNNAWVGFLADENTFSHVSTDLVYWADAIDFAALRKKYPLYEFKVEITTAAMASGTNTPIYPHEAKYVEYVEYGFSIPSYYEDEMNKTISSVRDAVNEPSLVFPLVTDIHFLSKSNISTLFNIYIGNVKYFSNKVPCDFIINLGDITDGDIEASETVRRNKYILEQFASVNAPYCIAIGNHDTNDYGTGNLTGGETFTAYLSNTKGVVFDTQNDDYHFNFYKDYDNLGIRLLVLDANYLDTYRYASSTANWLTNVALDTDNIVLLCEHLSSIGNQNWRGTTPTYGNDVTTALQSFVNGGGTLVQLCGHSHADYYFNTPWLTVFSGCQKTEQVDTTTSDFLAITGNIGGNAGIIAPTRTLGTVTEDLWSVCVLKPLSKEIDFIRFGAGVDRYFHFEKTVVSDTQTLTTVLDTVTWTTSDSSVATVSSGTVTAAGSGVCQITATDADGNFETWTVSVA